MFTMVAKYFEVFDQQEREVLHLLYLTVPSYTVSTCILCVLYVQDLIDMRLEFLWSLCCHEHYIALNLPFNIKGEN